MRSSTLRESSGQYSPLVGNEANGVGIVYKEKIS